MVLGIRNVNPKNTTPGGHVKNVLARWFNLTAHTIGGLKIGLRSAF